MRHTAIKPHVMIDPGPAAGDARVETKPSKVESVGDRLCCVGFIIAGLTGYGLVYWFITSYAR